MTDDVRKAAERLLNEARIHIKDYGCSPGHYAMADDILTVARFALAAHPAARTAAAGAEEARGKMPAAPQQAVAGATVRQITGGPPAECSYKYCANVAKWVVREEYGDDDYVWYSCNDDLFALVEDAILARSNDDDA